MNNKFLGMTLFFFVALAMGQEAPEQLAPPVFPDYQIGFSTINYFDEETHLIGNTGPLHTWYDFDARAQRSKVHFIDLDYTVDLFMFHSLQKIALATYFAGQMIECNIINFVGEEPTPDYMERTEAEFFGPSWIGGKKGEHWQTVYDDTQGHHVISDFYFGDRDNTPVRQVTRNGPSSFYVIDLISFQTTKPDPTVFIPPAECVPLNVTTTRQTRSEHRHQEIGRSVLKNFARF